MSDITKVISDFPKYAELFSRYGPMGYTIVINIWNVTPEYYYTTLPHEWIKEYTDNHYSYTDPVMKQLSTTGIKRWSEIPIAEIDDVVLTSREVDNVVMTKARHYNLNFGVVIVSKSATSNRKHFLSVARSDRELLDDEILNLSQSFEAMLSDLHPNDHLSDRQNAVLFHMSQGLTVQETAKEIGVSSETVKKDLQSARVILGAGSTTAAVAAAVSRKLIFPNVGARY